MAYKCIECGYVFGEYEVDRWVEEVGEYEGQPCMESHSGCPMCHGDYEEAERCEVCNGYYLESELHGGVCDECINEYRKDFNACYDISLGEKETIKINSLLATLFDEGDIQAILIEYIKTKCPDIDCSEYIDEDISWFGEQIAKEVKKEMKTPKTNRDEVRGNTLAILLTDAEKEAIEKEANKAGLSMSAWARMVLNEKVNRN